MPSSVPIFRPPRLRFNDARSHTHTVRPRSSHRPFFATIFPCFVADGLAFQLSRPIILVLPFDPTKIPRITERPRSWTSIRLRPDPECVSSTWSKQLDSIEMRPRDVFFPCHLFHRISIVQGISRVNACQKGVSRRMDFLLSSFIYPPAKIIRSEIDLRLFHPSRNRFDRRAYRER